MAKGGRFYRKSMIAISSSARGFPIQECEAVAGTMIDDGWEMIQQD
jgi:hypothetical protein